MAGLIERIVRCAAICARLVRRYEFLDEKSRIVAPSANGEAEKSRGSGGANLGRSLLVKMRDAVDLNDVQGAGWQGVDNALREISKRRGALDGLEARWLREALRVKIWREVGCVSMTDYLERRLGYAPRTASDRVRVAMALEDLPQIAKALEGGLPHSAVRELTRVATRDNEKTWLDAARGKSVHEIEELVSGRGRGSNPGDPKNPSLAGRTLPFEGIRPSTEASLRDARRELQDERGGGEVLTDDEVLAALTRHFLEGERGERTKAPYQIAVTLCEHCGRGWQQSGGRKHELSAAEIARACCDAERIGSLDGDAPERAAQDVTPAMRRFVYRRDGGRCRVPGCRSTRCLEIHHIVARTLGGSHEAENLILICDGCHAALHRGLITISGTSSALVVARRNPMTYVPTAGEASADAFGEAATECAELELLDGADLLEQTPTDVHCASTLPLHEEAVDVRRTTFESAAGPTGIEPADFALAEAALALGAASQTLTALTLAEVSSAHVGTQSPQRSTSAIEVRNTTIVSAADRSGIEPHALAGLAAGVAVQPPQTFAAPMLAEVSSAHVGTKSPPVGIKIDVA